MHLVIKATNVVVFNKDKYRIKLLYRRIHFCSIRNRESTMDKIKRDFYFTIDKKIQLPN